MSGKRQPTDVVVAKGKKHFSKNELADRSGRDVRPSKPVKQLRAPDYMPETLKKRFRDLARQLIELMPTMVARPDADTLARYVMAEQAYIDAYDREMLALTRDSTTSATKWAGVVDKHFKQCRSCAQDLGLTLSSRCGLVLPEPANKEPENPFQQLYELRRDA